MTAMGWFMAEYTCLSYYYYYYLGGCYRDRRGEGGGDGEAQGAMQAKDDKIRELEVNPPTHSPKTRTNRGAVRARGDPPPSKQRCPPPAHRMT